MLVSLSNDTAAILVSQVIHKEELISILRQTFLVVFHFSANKKIFIFEGVFLVTCPKQKVSQV